MLFRLFSDLDLYLDENFRHLGFTLDVLKLLIYFNLSIVMGLGLRLLSNPLARTLYSITAGIGFLLFLGQEWFVYIMSSSTAVYVAATILKRQCFWVVFVIAFGTLSYVHLYRLLYDYLSWKMDFNVIQMMATCRYLYYANAVVKQSTVPNFIEYIAYVFMFPNLVVGPIPCEEFTQFLRLEGDYKTIQYQHAPWLRNFAKATAFALAEVFVRPHCDESIFETWGEYSLLQRNLILYPIAICMRFRYYTAFKFTQAGIDALAITYQDGGYERFSVADYRYELEPSGIQKTNMWNSLVQLWLKNCLYERISQVFGEKPSFYITFAVSAVWHGFYLTYYYMFLSWALMNQVSKYVYKSGYKFAFIPYPIRFAIVYLIGTSWVNQLAIPVALLQWDKAIRFNADLGFNAHIGIVLTFTFFYVTQFGQQQRKKK